MSQAQVSSAFKPGTGATRAAFLRVVVAAAVLVGGSLGLSAMVHSLNWTIDKPPMPLRRPLPTVPKTLGENGQYAVAYPDKVMNKEMVESLGTSDYLVREYFDQRVTGAGSRLVLNVNYYPTGGSSPHVPDICWEASGMRKYEDGRQVVFKDVRHADGSVSDLPVMLLSYRPTSQEWADRPAGITDERDFLRNVVYTFYVNGQYVSTRHEVTSKFWKPGNKHAYHAKIEVTVPHRCSPEKALPAIEAFMRAALPEVEEALPDPRASLIGDPGGDSGPETSPAR